MQKRSSHRASLIAGIVAAVIFVGGIASDLIASDLQRILQPYRLWVWLTIIVALVVAVATAIAEAEVIPPVQTCQVQQIILQDESNSQCDCQTECSG